MNQTIFLQSILPACLELDCSACIFCCLWPMVVGCKVCGVVVPAGVAVCLVCHAGAITPAIICGWVKDDVVQNTTHTYTYTYTYAYAYTYTYTCTYT